MKRSLCLITALVLSLTAVSCSQVRARTTIRDANKAYLEGNYADALDLYKKAKTYEDFPELDRMIGYCYLGLFKAGDASPENQQTADNAAQYLSRYLEANDDDAAEEVLINLYLNAQKPKEAIKRLERSLKDNPNDVLVMKSIANLLASQGEARDALTWYERVIKAEPTKENFYTIGVVLYEMVSKGMANSREEALSFIEKGQDSLARALEKDPEYFDALVYTNLLYREEAVLTDDFAEKTALINKADEFRQRAIAIAKKRAAQAEAEKDSAEAGTRG